jgi:hypothetical protein
MTAHPAGRSNLTENPTGLSGQSPMASGSADWKITFNDFVPVRFEERAPMRTPFVAAIALLGFVTSASAQTFSPAELQRRYAWIGIS